MASIVIASDMVNRQSWHVPWIIKASSRTPDRFLHVIFLHRVSDEECCQILKNLHERDEAATNSLDVPKPPPRQLTPRKWIRHGWASSDVILKIAETLLSACDFNKGYTLAKILGDAAFEAAKVDLYNNTIGSSNAMAPVSMENYKLPKSLPQDLAFSRTELMIVSFRHLKQSEIDNLTHDVHKGVDEAPFIRIRNWYESSPSRAEIRLIYYRMQQNSGLGDRDMPLIFVDSDSEGKDGSLQLMWARLTEYLQTLYMFPVNTGNLVKIWKDAAAGMVDEDLHEDAEFVDTWGREYVHDLDVPNTFENIVGMPRFYLQPFTPEQERIVRSKLQEYCDLENREHYGADWVHFGYIWSDRGRQHSIEDLRDYFERCDPLSPLFEPSYPGHRRFDTYPRHFIAVDEKIFEPEPQVWFASWLGFELEEAVDELGWIYGLVPAKESHYFWVNANSVGLGPLAFLRDPRRLWLSDVKECQRELEERSEDEESDEESDEDMIGTSKRSLKR